MEKEIVKEIKKLIDCDKKQNEIGGIIVVNRRFLMEVLNLINELEVLCNKTYEDLTKEIDRLESENERLNKDSVVLATEEYEHINSCYNVVRKETAEKILEQSRYYGDNFYVNLKGILFELGLIKE